MDLVRSKNNFIYTSYEQQHKSAASFRAGTQKYLKSKVKEQGETHLLWRNNVYSRRPSNWPYNLIHINQCLALQPSSTTRHMNYNPHQYHAPTTLTSTTPPLPEISHKG